MKPKIKLYDKIFSHAHTMSNGHMKMEPDYFTWYRGEEKTNIGIYTDFSLSEINASNHKYNIALLMESPGVFGGPYNQIKEIEDKFDYIFTFDTELLKRSDKYMSYCLGGTWIPEKDWAVYHKTKFLSMISSVKDATYGQKLRHAVKASLSHRVDIYGKINDNHINNKLQGLRDYTFSIVTENHKGGYYFTEKLIDCFLTGVIPIYYGTDKVKDIFNLNGMVLFDSVDVLKGMISPGSCILSPNNYNKAIEAIAYNFNKAKEYIMPENQIGFKLTALGVL